jgi:hypothetical protein
MFDEMNESISSREKRKLKIKKMEMKISEVEKAKVERAEKIN